MTVAHDGRHAADERLLMLLASGTSIRAAASECEIGESTIWRRLRDPDFIAALNAARSQLWADALGRLTHTATKAADRLAALIDEAGSDAVKLAACKAVIELGCRLRDAVEIESRLQRLENSNNGKTPS